MSEPRNLGQAMASIVGRLRTREPATEEEYAARFEEDEPDTMPIQIAAARDALSGVPAMYRDAALTDWNNGGYSSTGMVNDVAQTFLSQFSRSASPLWLFLHGTPGTGKTRFACALLNEARQQENVYGRFVKVPDLLDRLRATFAEDSEESTETVMRAFKSVPLLVLDDIGAEYPSKWATERLYAIIDHRYSALTPTIFTTNLDPGALDFRVRDRVGDVHLCRTVSFSGLPNRRRL